MAESTPKLIDTTNSKKDEENEMEIDNTHLEELSKLETVKQKQNPENTEIDFEKIKVSDLASKGQYRRVPVPRHRLTPLK